MADTIRCIAGYGPGLGKVFPLLKSGTKPFDVVIRAFKVRHAVQHTDGNGQSQAPSAVKDAIGPGAWSRKDMTWDASQAPLPVNVAATLSPVSASMPMCKVRQARRVAVPCSSSGHSPPPAPHSSSVRAAHQQVHGLGTVVRAWPKHLQRFRPAACGGMLQHREIEPGQGDDGADQVPK